MLSKRPTTTDIARLTGYSTATVSRVLSGRGRVSDKARMSVEKKANELGYSPSQMAQAVAKESRLLELCVHPHLGWLAAPYCEALKAHLPERTLLMHPQLATDKTVTPSQVLVKSLEDDAAFLVAANTYVAVAASNSVDPSLVDNRSAAFTLASYLMLLGHVHIVGVVLASEARHVRSRLEGFRAALQAACLHAVVLYCTSELHAYQNLRRQRQPFSAVVCLSVGLLAGVLAALEDEQRAVPEDVSLVSFADLNGEPCDVTAVRPDPRGFARAVLSAWQERVFQPIPTVLVESGTTSRWEPARRR